MIRRILCIRRLPELTSEQFQQHWRGVHGPLVQKHAKTLGTLRYRQLQPLPVADGAPRTGGEPFDGIAEIWYDPDVRDAANATPEGQRASKELTDDGRTFIDHSRSVYMVVDEPYSFESP